jgi:osmoprotectant transport system permease protein
VRLIEFWTGHAAEFGDRLGQHVMLVVVSSLVATAMGVPLGILAARRPRLGAPVIAVANLIETVPSLAVFGFLIPLPLIGGIGTRTAMVALILYGLLPVIRTTAAGLRSVERPVVEAGLSLGMKPAELLMLVELPLALPSIVAGIRIAAVVGVGTATIAAAIGAGGLGEYVYRGLSMVDTTVILAGAIPAAALAIGVDAGLSWVERRLSPQRRRQRRKALLGIGLAVVALLAASGAWAAHRAQRAIVVGSKNFTEQVLLGEMLAQVIEDRAGLPVARRLNLGGTAICDWALQHGDLDVYVEYTGTALTAIFHQEVDGDPQTVLSRVRERYAQTGRTVLPPLGFDNTFAIVVRNRDARELGLRTIGDLARHSTSWRAGVSYEFLDRPDGYAGLVAAYRLEFAAPPRVMDLALLYRALQAGQVDVVAASATDGLIDALGMTVLEDDRHYFPPYQAVPVMVSRTLFQNPRLRPAVDWLSGKISEPAMRRLNHAVDVEHRDPAEVAREFLQSAKGK